MIEGARRTVQIDAWTGDGPVVGSLGDRLDRWGLDGRASSGNPFRDHLAPASPPDMRDWRDPRVGWGLLAPELDGVPDADLARGVGLADAFRRLLEARPGSPVFRYRPVAMCSWIRRVHADGRPSRDINVAAAPFGTADDAIPRYLLIAAGPGVIPWRQQNVLNVCCAVGRLDPDGPGLDNYVDHLLADWGGSGCVPRSPVVWSVDHGPADITALMQRVIADPLWARMAADAELAGRRLPGSLATGPRLAEALAARPDLVVTTSHGMTGTRDTPADLLSVLGLPVDATHQVVTADVLADEAIPGGAIWYAHACCSAGSDRDSFFADLFPAGSSVGDAIRNVSSRAGSAIGALPRRLLGAPEPVRAFVGHVEPTFDWTLSDPLTGCALSRSFVDAFYERLYQPGMPVGLALAEVYAEIGRFLALWKQSCDRIAKGCPGAVETAAFQQIAALDRQAVVLLGDPTVTLAGAGRRT